MLGSSGSQQHSPFLQPVGTRIFWGYFRSVLACICPGRAQAQLTLPVVNTRVAMSTEIPAWSTEIPAWCRGAAQRKAGVEPWAFPKGQQSKGRAGGAGREGRSHLTIAQNCLFPSGSRTLPWKEPPVQAEGGHRVGHGCGFRLGFS